MAEIGVGSGQVIVVVGMKIEIQFRIAGDHIQAEIIGLLLVQDPQGIGQHEPVDAFILQCIQHLVHVFGRVAHAVGPVLEIDVHSDAHLPGKGQHIFHIGNVFFGGFPELGSDSVSGSLS